MRDADKPWIFSIVCASLVALVVASFAGCSAGTSSAEAPKSRWWKIEAPRDDLECWETQLARGYREGGQYHVECWPKTSR